MQGIFFIVWNTAINVFFFLSEKKNCETEKLHIYLQPNGFINKKHNK